MFSHTQKATTTVVYRLAIIFSPHLGNLIETVLHINSMKGFLHLPAVVQNYFMFRDVT